MSGKPLSLYFHIPFCNRKCPYCHFYVIPNKQEHKDLLLDALLLEWKSILPKVQNHEIVSIYFGGGTPTLFGAQPIGKLLETVYKDCTVLKDCEITIEANPEDVTDPLMSGYKSVGINRVSIGVQSLQDESLIVLERTHNSNKAIDAIECTYRNGIQNISIDLMYDLPDQTVDSFQKTLGRLESLPISHLSLYNLTIEPHTSFYKRTLNLPSSEESFRMLNLATAHLEKIGLKRYEISAFAKLGFESRHNTGYWTARPFFGLGPSAFSYYEGVRYRNVANINRYSKALSTGISPVDFEEKLIYPDNINELLAVELRLLKGVQLEKFPLTEHTSLIIKDLIHKGYLHLNGNILRLSDKGLLFYDLVASEII